jgi:hypothetical protein
MLVDLGNCAAIILRIFGIIDTSNNIVTVERCHKSGMKAFERDAKRGSLS